MDIVILLSLAAGIIVILVVLAIFKKIVKQEPAQDEQLQRAAQIDLGGRRRVVAPHRTARARQRMALAQEQDGDDDDDDDDGMKEGIQAIEIPKGKIGAKKLAKLQAKAEKKAMREAEEKNREEKRKAQEFADEQQRLQEEKEEAQQKEREDRERKEREEKERQEHEEYLKLKQGFSVQEEGFEEGEVELENMLMEFVNFIKENKVVVLEDIAAKFRLKTQHAIDRIQQLQAEGILTGVIDDRGKFIYVSEEELRAVAKFVKQRGRVSIVELVENSNRLINLVPNVGLSS